VKLILTNDDGIEAPGLNALENALGSLGELVVVAPEYSQSEIGHQVTTKAPIRVRQISLSRYGVSGTPADCARIALTVFHPDADWLIAGINRGGNLGADIYMSGTVAAAREAALLGIKAIAISHYVADNREVDWALAVLNRPAFSTSIFRIRRMRFRIRPSLFATWIRCPWQSDFVATKINLFTGETIISALVSWDAMWICALAGKLPFQRFLLKWRICIMPGNKLPRMKRLPAAPGLLMDSRAWL